MIRGKTDKKQLQSNMKIALRKSHKLRELWRRRVRVPRRGCPLKEADRGYREEPYPQLRKITRRRCSSGSS